MNIKAVLFDMDGLIFDTEGLYKTCWQYAADEQELLLSDDDYQSFIGVQDAECERRLVNQFGEMLDLARFRQVRDAMVVAEREKGVAYKPGFDVIFAFLKQQNLKCALVTSSALAQVKHHFADSGYLAQFDVVITSENVTNGKPAPDCYLMACEQLDIAPADCLVLEDSNNGMRAGLDAGCHAVMIPDLLSPAADVAERAMAIVTSLSDVKAYL
ncbi:HAD family phosphatase [Photobacterium sanctipauli]|uniref:HAD family phosphatase n=1 Tax=Photobacterium sanctipauli TaxID=1342794 RepID=A0A2T3NWU9_9GAMM|nr:HAD family phosphatase [Photobacterium sanctipauli]PSW20767.1 HAD family phosphatase [Photobacterium sanctipauli]